MKRSYIEKEANDLHCLPFPWQDAPPHLYKEKEKDKSQKILILKK